MQKEREAWDDERAREFHLGAASRLCSENLRAGQVAAQSGEREEQQRLEQERAAWIAERNCEFPNSRRVSPFKPRTTRSVTGAACGSERQTRAC